MNNLFENSTEYFSISMHLLLLFVSLSQFLIVLNLRMVLTPEQCAQAVVLREQGRSLRYIANLLQCNPSTVLRTINRYRETGSNNRRRELGRRRATNATQDRFLILQTLRDRFQPSTRSAQLLREVHGLNVSRWTVRRRLCEGGLMSRRPANGPELSPEHRRMLLEFARRHLHWTTEQ